ncbi:MAG: cell division protein FtsA [bacterium]|nr:cell division protein FtsA [bacterium]
MAKLETLTALDIGTSKVVCAIVEFSRDGELDIVAKGVHHCSGLSRGALIDTAATVESIDKAVNEAEQSGYTVGNVLVGISSEFVSSRYNSGAVAVSGLDQEITKEDISRVLNASRQVGVPSGSEIVTVVPRSFIVDGQRGITNPESLIGNRLEAEAYACIASSAYLQNIRNVVAKAGLDIYERGIIPSAMASSLAVLTEEEKKLGVMMVDIGLGTLDMAVYAQNEIAYSSVLGQGGWILASDVAKSFNISQSKAESLILEEGLVSTEYLHGDGDKELTVQSVSEDVQVTLTKRELAEVIEARVNEILSWLKKQMDYASSEMELNISSVVFTGGTSQLLGLAQKTRSVLGVPARVAAPCYPARLPQSLASPIYSTVVGLLIYGVTCLPEQKQKKATGGYTMGFIQRIAEWINQVF